MEESHLKIKHCCQERFAPVLLEINRMLTTKKDPILIAIDGKCASGKTTLGYYLKKIYNCNLFHMDDFFLQDHQRTNVRLSEIGGNVDYERFAEEVLAKIHAKENIAYRPFRCSDRQLQDATDIPYHRINIIEGSYSMHPSFGERYDVKVFMDIREEDQLINIRNRNGEEQLARFIEEWIPKENAYFSTFSISKGCLRIHW